MASPRRSNMFFFPFSSLPHFYISHWPEQYYIATRLPQIPSLLCFLCMERLKWWPCWKSNKRMTLLKWLYAVNRNGQFAEVSSSSEQKRHQVELINLKIISRCKKRTAAKLLPQNPMIIRTRVYEIKHNATVRVIAPGTTKTYSNINSP